MGVGGSFDGYDLVRLLATIVCAPFIIALAIAFWPITIAYGLWVWWANSD